MQHFATATERRGIVFGKRIGDGTEGPPRSFISSNSQLNSARVLPRETHTHCVNTSSYEQRSKRTSDFT